MRFVQDEDILEASSYSVPTTGTTWSTPDISDAMFSADTSLASFTPTPNSSKVKFNAASSKMSSWAGTPRLKTSLKCTLHNVFAEGSVKDDQALEHLGTQKHEHAIGELKLKRHKLENKVMVQQDQCEQHEFRILQLQVMATRGLRAAPVMMQSQNPSELLMDRFGLMAELNAATLPSESSSSTPYST